jgi:hypothetical protein
MSARIDDLMVLVAHLSKTDFAKYLRDRTAIQAAFDRAAADSKMAVIPPSTWNVSVGVVLGSGARGLIMRGVLRYTETPPQWCRPSAMAGRSDALMVRGRPALQFSLLEQQCMDAAIAIGRQFSDQAQDPCQEVVLRQRRPAPAPGRGGPS